MSDNRKYYYLKLKENYFDDDSIVLLESMQDGVLYSNILLKLYLKSLKHGGRLQLDEDIPYTAQMIATITRQQIGTVERALQIFLKLGLVEVLDSGTFYMSNIELLIGQSSTEAERKRAARLQNKALSALRTSGGHKQKRYEDEVIRCLDGQSRFSEEMLARLIAEAETEVRQAKEEYAELLRNDTTRATIQQIRSYYDEFLGWANEFDLATIPRKRAILGQLIEKVEVGKGYKVTVHLRMSYAQFLGIEGNGEIQVRKDVCA